MTYADKGLALFSLMNDMSDTLINESDIGVASVTPKRARTGRFSAFMNHPAMVAVLCAVVSLGVVMAILVTGWNAPPAGHPADNVYLLYQTPETSEGYCRVTPPEFFSWGGNGDFCADGKGFCVTAEDVKDLPLVQNIHSFELHLVGKRELRTVTVYNAETGEKKMKNSAVFDEPLTPGLYYVSLAVVSQSSEGSSGIEYAFALLLSEAVDELTFHIVADKSGEPVLPKAENEITVQYAKDYTLTVENKTWSVYENSISFTVMSKEQGAVLGGQQKIHKICRVEDGIETLIFSGGGGEWRAVVSPNSDSMATMTVYCYLEKVWETLAKENETLTPGTYRFYYRLSNETPEQYAEITLAEIPGGDVVCATHVSVLAAFSHGICAYVEGKGNVFISYTDADTFFSAGDAIYIACRDMDFFPTSMTIEDESLSEPFIYQWNITSYVVLRPEKTVS